MTTEWKRLTPGWIIIFFFPAFSRFRGIHAHNLGHCLPRKWPVLGPQATFCKGLPTWSLLAVTAAKASAISLRLRNLSVSASLGCLRSWSASFGLNTRVYALSATNWSNLNYLDGRKPGRLAIPDWHVPVSSNRRLIINTQTLWQIHFRQGPSLSACPFKEITDYILHPSLIFSYNSNRGGFSLD